MIKLQKNKKKENTRVGERLCEAQYVHMKSSIIKARRKAPDSRPQRSLHINYLAIKHIFLSISTFSDHLLKIF